MLLEVLYRSVQRGGGLPETGGQSDSPIMVAQACFQQEGAALSSDSGQGLGASPCLGAAGPALS